jgi:hypothetical protein
MEKPIYNRVERWEIREINCTITAGRKLNIAVLHLLRLFQIEIDNFFNYVLRIITIHYKINK